MTKMNWIVVFVVAALLTGYASSKSGEVMFAVGDRVRVLTGRDGTTRVEK